MKVEVELNTLFKNHNKKNNINNNNKNNINNTNKNNKIKDYNIDNYVNIELYYSTLLYKININVKNIHKHYNKIKKCILYGTVYNGLIFNRSYTNNNLLNMQKNNKYEFYLDNKGQKCIFVTVILESDLESNFIELKKHIIL
tara:strand:- start:119 stop:544 length:426 start_codon:yes stop_codon:yes gene_type:complete